MPLKPTVREPERGLRYLEDKLALYVNGPSPTRRNPALDVLTGRAPDLRVASPPVAPVPPAETPRQHPATVVLPRVARPVAPAYKAAPRHAPSPWLEPTATEAPRLRLTPPPPARPSLRTLAPRALAIVVTAAAALGLGMAIRGYIVDRPAPAAAPVVVVSEPTAAPTTAPTSAPTVAPTSVPPTKVPTLAPTLAPKAPAQADQFRVMLDEQFDRPRFAWLDVPGGAAWLADGSYHLEARSPGQFVAVGVPGAADLGDVVVSGSFHKTGGPAGGGYGLIVRDHPGADGRDGVSQDGRFYVFEVGDKGELGIWLRDAGRWVDLLPWTVSDTVKPGLGVNDLTVSAIGDTLSFQVNGIPVASQHDTVLNHGGAAIFVGGDGNQVALDHLTVRVPR